MCTFHSADTDCIFINIKLAEGRCIEEEIEKVSCMLSYIELGKIKNEVPNDVIKEASSLKSKMY